MNSAVSKYYRMVLNAGILSLKMSSQEGCKDCCFVKKKTIGLAHSKSRKNIKHWLLCVTSQKNIEGRV